MTHLLILLTAGLMAQEPPPKVQEAKSSTSFDGCNTITCDGEGHCMSTLLACVSVPQPPNTRLKPTRKPRRWWRCSNALIAVTPAP